MDGGDFLVTPFYFEVQGRIDRARDLQTELIQAIARLFETTPPETRTEHDPNSGLANLILRTPSMPLRYALIVSDVAHQLRSALDNLLFMLVHGETMSPDDQSKIEFPIRLDAKSYPKNPERRCLFGASTELRDAIWNLQPFRSDDATSHLLGLVHEVNRIDKHRFPASASTHSIDEVTPSHVAVTPIDPVQSVTRLRVFNAGAEGTEFPIASVITDPKSARVELSIASTESLRFDVVFGHGPRFTALDLESAIDAVENICTDLWDRFGQPDAPPHHQFPSANRW